MNIVLYSTGCAKCKVLEQKLKDKRIAYEECNDVNVMVEKGMLSAPYLEVDGTMMTYTKAIQWVNELEA